MRNKSTILKLLIAIIVVYMLFYQFIIVNFNSHDDKKAIVDGIKKDILVVNNNFKKSIEIQYAKQIIDKSSLYLNGDFNAAYLKYRNYSNNYADASFKYVNYESNIRDSSLNKKFYLIVEHTRIFSQTKYCEKKLDYELYKDLLDNQLFKQLNLLAKSSELNDNNRLTLLDECSFKNCFFTCDKKHVDNADALLFHEADLISELNSLSNKNANRLSNKELVEQLSPIKNRKREQVWILWNDEANRVSDKLDGFLFNWTISYKYESEVAYGAYGVYSPSGKTDRNEIEFKQNLLESFKKRKNEAVWFNSNCNSRYRIDAANALGEHFPLNVYGSCSSEVKSRQNKNATECPRDSNCQSKSLEESKFYLALESKNCSDYITEKYWRTLSHGLIPVLIQPSKLFYERISPPNSYIHAEDFNYDYKQLADYLTGVSNNFDLYYNYFKWTKNTNEANKYDVIFDMRLEKLRMCELCMKMNKEKSEIYYKSVSKYFNDQCVIN